MKITRLRTVVVDLPIEPTIVSAIFAIRSTSCILCFLETDQGLVGEGLVHAINGLRVKVLHEMVHSLEPLVLGLDPTLGGSVNARAWKELNFLGYEGVTIQALAGIDMALWDLRGKAAELNVSRLIGAVRLEAPVYASGGLWLSSSIDELQREAADFIAAGFRAVKMRVAPGKPDAMVARVRAVREAIGPDIGLMVDANQQLSVPEAIHLGRALEPFELSPNCDIHRCRLGKDRIPRIAAILLRAGNSVRRLKRMFRPVAGASSPPGSPLVSGFILRLGSGARRCASGSRCGH
jgi:L-alanine-DL-glutamate epimerase-like enolase superfamily enzyme